MQMTSSSISSDSSDLIIDSVCTRPLFDNKEANEAYAFTSCRFAALFNQLR